MPPAARDRRKPVTRARCGGLPSRQTRNRPAQARRLTSATLCVPERTVVQQSPRRSSTGTAALKRSRTPRHASVPSPQDRRGTAADRIPRRSRAVGACFFSTTWGRSRARRHDRSLAWIGAASPSLLLLTDAGATRPPIASRRAPAARPEEKLGASPLGRPQPLGSSHERRRWRRHPVTDKQHAAGQPSGR